LAPYGDDADEAVMRPLADDLADIWRDLKQGLLAVEEGASAEYVLAAVDPEGRCP
jgi:hypothetical protein